MLITINVVKNFCFSVLLIIEFIFDVLLHNSNWSCFKFLVIPHTCCLGPGVCCIRNQNIFP